MRKIVYVFTFYVLTFVVACEDSSGPPKQNKPGVGDKNKELQVEAYVIQPSPYAETLEIPGTLSANESVAIQPEINGRIVTLNVQEGRLVEKGALLVKLYDGDLVAQLHKLEVQLQLAQKTEERQSQLLKIQGISQQDYDISLLQVNNLKADIGIIKTTISKTEIRAPFSGRLGLRNISEGAFVSPSTIISTINQTNQLKLDFSIPEKYINKLRIGQPIQFTTEGSPREYTAKVSATESAITENSRSLLIRAKIMNPDAAVLPGSFAKVKLSFDPDPSAILVPTQSIIPQAKGKKVIVIKNGKAVFTDVITGVRSADKIQILSGLQPNDTIAVTGLMSLRPDNNVAVSKIQSPTP
ncbi:MAG: efflux RND transporter periplasmic adaptor subunit [Chitinophagaceae bacterium]